MFCLQILQKWFIELLKNRKLHIALVISLLAVTLIGRVGIHLFHHHETTFFSNQKFSKKTLNLFSEEKSDVDCLLCKLDTFQEVIVFQIIPFVFFLYFEKCRYKFLVSTIINFSFLSKSRGPPAFNSVA